jgi:hypothetical protein
MGYRFSDATIKKWEKVLTWWLVGGIVAAFLLAGGALGLHEALGVEEGSGGETVLMGAVIAGLGIGVLTVVGVIYLAAILGGLSLHRHGWILGALLATWLLVGWWPAFSLGGLLGHAVYWGVFAVIIAAFRYLGAKAKVPMWVQAPVPGSPRILVHDGEIDDRQGPEPPEPRDR